MDVVYSPDSWPVSPLTLVAITISTYLILLSIYRLYFHPLAKFPGPKLPALTGWYEFYYECILGGRYFAEILRMHDQYGIYPRIQTRLEAPVYSLLSRPDRSYPTR
jgi:hypothetical protein